MTNAVQLEWIIPSIKDEPNPPASYVVSFTHFHEQGFGMPTSNFFRKLLHHCGIELHNLNPNSVLQIVVFVALCEGYLASSPTLPCGSTTSVPQSFSRR
jgi:hypothetical protein